MPRNKALLDLLDELNEEQRPPRRLSLCVVCSNPIKSVNGVALCGASVHPIHCTAEHIMTCPKCKKEMEANANQQQTIEARGPSTGEDRLVGEIPASLEQPEGL